MQTKTCYPPLWFCTQTKYYVKSGMTNVLKNPNKAKHIRLFFIWIAYYNIRDTTTDTVHLIYGMSCKSVQLMFRLHSKTHTHFILRQGRYY